MMSLGILPCTSNQFLKILSDDGIFFQEDYFFQKLIGKQRYVYPKFDTLVDRTFFKLTTPCEILLARQVSSYLLALY